MSVAIDQLEPLHLRNLVFEALRRSGAFGADVIDQFLDRLDWTNAGEANPETVAMLGLIRDASRQYERGDLPLSGYRDICVAVFFPDRLRLETLTDRRAQLGIPGTGAPLTNSTGTTSHP